MSAKKKGKGFEAPGDTARLTAAEFQELGFFFKRLLENKYLAPWVIAAGIGAILEGLHVLWLAARYLLGRYRSDRHAPLPAFPAESGHGLPRRYSRKIELGPHRTKAY
jgi:hypothetical protein